jgi:hypothetical protein
MNDESIPQELINYRRYVLNTMWGGAMHWFAASRGDIEIDSHMPPRELQDARKMGEMYFDRFEKEAEKLLADLQSSGDIQISGPEEGILKTRRKSARHAINAEEHQDIRTVYQHGRNAAQRGKHIQSCPFDTGSPEWREWRLGFCDESSSHPQPVRYSVLSVPEVSQLFDDIMKAASKKAEPIVCNVVLMNAGRQTEVSMAIALALQYQLKNALA